MIYYLVTKSNSYTMLLLLKVWAPQLEASIQIVPYESLPRFDFPSGTYIFTDLERLRGLRLRVARDVAEHVASRLDSTLVNDPREGLTQRLSFLRTLSDEGINRYRAYPLIKGILEAELPAFIRSEGEHQLASGLVETRGALAVAASRAVARSILFAAKRDVLPRRQIVVEFYDSRPDPRSPFAKHSAFLIGDRVVPRHLVFGRHWYLKRPAEIDEELLAAEWSYLQENPHEDWIRTIFAKAGIDYGRLDYSMGPEGPVVWEINTNPIFLRLRADYDPAHLRHQEWFLGRLVDAFETLDKRRATASPTGSTDAPKTWALMGARVLEPIARRRRR